MLLNINSDAAVKFTNTLEQMHRSALPNAVRNTLNSVAFDVKQNTMPASASKEFTNRVPNFWKANSRVQMAKGFNIGSMEAVVGFYPKGGPGSDHAVDDLEEQEYGGTIESRSFIPMTSARGGNQAKPVRPQNRLGRVKKIINANTIEGKTPQQQFIHAVNKAGKGGFVIGNNSRKTLFRVESAEPGNIKLKALFSYEKGRNVRVSGKGFMRSASLVSAGKMESIYAREAQKQIDRLK